MHDLDMDWVGARDRDRLLDGFEHPVRLVPDMREISGLVLRDDGAQRHDLGRLGERAWRREQARREAERAGAEPLLQEPAHLVEFGGARRAVLQAQHHQPQRIVADQHARINRDGREGFEVVGKARLAKRQPRSAAAQIIGQHLHFAG